jgi:hypothetical protein
MLLLFGMLVEGTRVQKQEGKVPNAACICANLRSSVAKTPCSLWQKSGIESGFKPKSN